MDLGRMDSEKAKRTAPAFSARWEFLKNTINIDKLTGFSCKFLTMQMTVIKRVII